MASSSALVSAIGKETAPIAKSRPDSSPQLRVAKNLCYARQTLLTTRIPPAQPWRACPRLPSRSTPRVAPSRTTVNLSPRDVEVVTVGEALFDLLAADDQMGKPRAEVDSWSPFPGGAPTNVATALSQLGVSTALFTALGRDDLGDQLYDVICKRGVNVSGVIRTDRATRGVYVERKVDGDRVFAGFDEPMDSFADCFIDPQKLPLELVEGAYAVVSGTLGLAYPVTAKGMEAVVDKAKSSGVKVLVDVNWRPMFWPDPDAAKPIIEDFIAKADILKVTDEEAQWLYGIEAAKALKSPELVLEKLPNCQAVLVTAGEKGAAYSVKTGGKGTAQGFVPVLEVQVADTTGAGDAFTAGFLAFLIKYGGLDKLQSDPSLMHQAALFGAATGALTCCGKGAIAPQPTMEQVEAKVKMAA